MNTPSIHWFRLDLRLADNPALHAARKLGDPVVPVFIWSPEEEAPWSPGGASKWWLHQSLAAFDAGLREAGSRLLIRCGPTLETLRSLVKETGAKAVFGNCRCEPAVIARDKAIKEGLHAEGIEAESFNAALLHEPWTIQNPSGKLFQVFTPFWRYCLTNPDPDAPLPAPKQIASPARWPKSLALAGLQLEPRIQWAEGFRTVWQPGEAGAAVALTRIFHSQIERRSGGGVTRLENIEPNETATHRFFGDRL